MKLAFYNDQIAPRDRYIDALVMAMLPEEPSIRFVPSGGDSMGKWSEIPRAHLQGWVFGLIARLIPSMRAGTSVPSTGLPQRRAVDQQRGWLRCAA